MKDWMVVLPSAVIGLTGFGLGFFAKAMEPVLPAPLCLEKNYQEISIVELKEIEGDILNLSVSGPTRIVWNESFVEGDGDHQIEVLPQQYLRGSWNTSA